MLFTCGILYFVSILLKFTGCNWRREGTNIYVEGSNHTHSHLWVIDFYTFIIVVVVFTVILVK